MLKNQDKLGLTDFYPSNYLKGFLLSGEYVGCESAYLEVCGI
ncbi:27657_t:CDS:2 [Dentiscutata erythropus]|uniref:27657_t:CDS:1 n=1 Tax=Dentiscutata erythropus TaxID=1348616 RepID=A0A9N9DH60_9GLOM|nr:27657_t:CDS:2 [Dentiscutata erythropus]